jgi:hypothetical protein
VRRFNTRPRLNAALLGGFGVFALLVSVIGLYSGLSYGVTQRTPQPVQEELAADALRLGAKRYSTSDSLISLW